MNQQFIGQVEDRKFAENVFYCRLTFSQHAETICTKLSVSLQDHRIFHGLQSDYNHTNLQPFIYSMIQ